MTQAERRLVAGIAARYAGCGRFARHYVAGKLRHDPLTGALLASGRLGHVLDLGCGRGQFAALLLASGVADRVTGLELSGALLADARRALAGLPFEGRQQDLARDLVLPAADTVLMADMLYQLPPAAQDRLLAAAGAVAPRLLIRTADPDAGPRAWFTGLVERIGRPFWPHAGAAVAPPRVRALAARLTAAGFCVSSRPCRAGTPFSNVLLDAVRR